MCNIQHYVLFPNHDNGMRLYRELKARGIKTVIAPTPRSVSKCCGISLMIEEKDIEVIHQCVKEHNIEILEIAAVPRDVNPHRDKYC
ncbi:MAG: DUF3343 domain-containing protein [Muricomes sp.]